MAKHTPFTKEYFLEKGFIEQPDGSFIAPKPLQSVNLANGNILVKDIDGEGVDKEFIIPKEYVAPTIDFHAVPPTSWFIRGYNVPSKKNSRQNFVKNGKQVSIPSKLHAAYVKSTAMQYEVFGREFRAAVEYYKLTYPLYIEFHFIRGSRHSFDYCNACQTCEDIMKDEVSKKTGLVTKKGWFPDDSADYIIPVFKPYDYDKQDPGVKIKLLINK